MDLIHYDVKVLMATNVVKPISVGRGTPSISPVLLMDDGVGGFPPNKYGPHPS
jgi:hypothetical protein